jgi:uncharacterized repeat protein (TIGR03803 family)
MIFRLATLLGLAPLLSATGASALIFTNLYVFSAGSFPAVPNAVVTNSDGVNPNGFVVANNTLYGTAAAGGLFGYGTLFRLDLASEHFTNLFDFSLGTFQPGTATYLNSTGDSPNPGLLLVNNTLYGTTYSGGEYDAGAVFKINTDGSSFAVVHSFNSMDGQGPSSGLTLYGNALYGTTSSGGTSQDGTIFQINLNNLSFVSLYSFTNQEQPYGGVVVSSNLIYGFGRYGGASSNGVVYSFGLDGSGYTDLFDFDGTNGSSSYSTPVLSGNTLFGVTYQGGTNGGGNVFRINTDGQQYANLYSFQPQSATNTTGFHPYDFAGLVLSGNRLFGTTSVGGAGAQGTVFQLYTNGSGFTVLHSFQYSDGGHPESLILSRGTLYGMSSTGLQGMPIGNGGVFELILQPALNLAFSGNQAILTWNDPSYFLYSAPSITNAFAKITGATSPFTNGVTATQGFFQIRSN